MKFTPESSPLDSSSFGACKHGWIAALADRNRQFHPDMDVTDEQRYTSLAGGMSPLLIMV